MTQIKIKRVYTPIEPSDGMRILVDRLWPRGISREMLHCDLWAKELAPSTELREWFHTDPEAHWEEFRKRYLTKLETSEEPQATAAVLRGEPTITLLYASKDPIHNHALILQHYLQDQLR